MKTRTRFQIAAIGSFVVMLLGSAAVPTAAQNGPVQPGEEVRIRWEYGSAYGYLGGYWQTAVGEVVDANPTHIMLRRGERFFTVPLSSVVTLERRVGTKPASAPRMVVGSGLGFLGAMAFGILQGQADPTIESPVDYGLSMGVLVGAPVGALVAWATSRERGIYERVGLRQLVSGWTIGADGRVGLTVQVPGG